jgi:hypothetical protein
MDPLEENLTFFGRHEFMKEQKTANKTNAADAKSRAAD